MKFENINSNEKLRAELQNAKDIEDLYEVCKKADSSLTPEEFEDFLVSCCKQIEETSEEALEKVAGGKILDKNVSKKVASLVLGTLALGSSTGFTGSNKASALAETRSVGVSTIKDLGFAHIYSKEEVKQARAEFDKLYDECADLIEKIDDNFVASSLQSQLNDLSVSSEKTSFVDKFFDRFKYKRLLESVTGLESVRKNALNQLRREEASKAKEESNNPNNQGDNESKEALLKNQNQTFNNYKINNRTSLSVLKKNIESCMNGIKDASLQQVFGADIDKIKADINEQLKLLEGMTLSDEIRNDDIQVFTQNLDGYFADFKLELDSLTKRCDKLVKDVTNASNAVKKQLLMEAKDRFSNVIRELETKISDEFASQDITDDYLVRIQQLEADVRSSFNEICAKIDAMSSIDDVQDIERALTLFNSQLNRAIASKDDVVARFRERQRKERRLEARSNFEQLLTMLRSGLLTLDDVIGGNEKMISDLRNMINLYRGYRKTNKGDLPKGIIFYGAPGVGKTTGLRAIAAAEKLPVVLVRPGGTEEQAVEKLTNAFSEAKTLGASLGPDDGPAILILDEIDAICSQRKAEKTNKLTTAMIGLLDDLKPQDNVLIAATTNLLEAVDSAIRRAGRLKPKCEVAKPQEDGIRKILKVTFSGFKLEGQMSLDEFVENFVGPLRGCTGADIYEIANDAIQQRLNKSSTNMYSDITLYVSDVNEQIEKLRNNK